MRSDITIVFDSRRSLDLSASVEPSPQRQSDARDWFDSAWETLGCEPLRPSGKVLLLDKVLGVADALGYETLSSDEKEAREFAEHLALALERPRITVDLPGLTVGY
ncbi:hypothetical protein QEP16_00710 [Achromobacter insolitus]|uniref:Uncharacterized protein n=1 Tax=Achromobacter insolitus TaxID=217204 RepID=A0A6S7FIV6_9BURK|nr:MULTISPECIES: hypothetical protein [Achromobacter]GLK95277.1 hypothetical protein GCM10008164_30170 [Achromobacter xylosoxidans]APX78011.1 hypothetical protein BUW96_26405 [Achromobacter insolitus]AVG42022.1 hypothetical protein MC81_22970 [Achromobacter insolitus]MCP1400496.1 hypothetical protein [Achromobacter insolitus]MDH3061818.1 hypothetical protein [Achromobacter insolitus]